MDGTRVSASEFKAHCLRLLEGVERTGVPLIVTRRGRPVVRISPAEPVAGTSLLGSVTWSCEEDLVGSVEEPWEADQ